MLFIGSGATFEVAKIASSSGGGPQTETLAQPLKFAHAAGEPVIANFAVGDELIISGVVTSDGGVPVSIKATMPGGLYSPQPLGSIPAAITRGVFYQRVAVPSGTSGVTQFTLNVAAGTGVASIGRFGVYNATRLGI